MAKHKIQRQTIEYLHEVISGNIWMKWLIALAIISMCGHKRSYEWQSEAIGFA